MKRLMAFALSCALTIPMLAACGTTSASIEVENEDYYKKFVDQNISINVYNWGEYISDGSDADIPDVNAEFERLTGITVNYTTYNTNEQLYAKLRGGGASYDIIIPSDYMISRMIDEDMLEPINYDNIPNIKYIADEYKNKEYDPESKFSVPYTWGTVGIIYNKNEITDDNFGWEILWDEKYADKILMFDNPRDAFAIAENLLGYSMNTEDPSELEAAAKKLEEQKPIVQGHVMDEVFDKMGAEEAYIAPYYAGDAKTLMSEFDFLGFKIPESGTNSFYDAICIPKDAVNKEAAEMYINFLLEPDTAYYNTKFIGYATPNKAAYERLDDDVKNDGFSYPSAEFLTNKTEVFKNLSSDANKKMQDLWIEIKTHD